MSNLLLDSYALSSRPFNWRLATIDNWNYASRYLEPLEYFTDRVHVWRAGDGKLASFLIRYYNTTYLQVDYAYRSLEPRMLAWAEENWAAKGTLQTEAFEYDAVREELLRQRGYADNGPSGYVRLYDLEQTYPSPHLPDGFRIASVGELGDSAGRIALERAVWNIDVLNEAWFRGKSSAPSYSLEWDLVAVSPENVQVAACLVWIDARNRAAEIDPLGTHPDFRRQGLARALILESICRLSAVGVRLLYIGSNSANMAANNLYSSLAPRETYVAHTWIKRF